MDACPLTAASPQAVETMQRSMMCNGAVLLYAACHTTQVPCAELNALPMPALRRQQGREEHKTTRKKNKRIGKLLHTGEGERGMGG